MALRKQHPEPSHSKLRRFLSWWSELKLEVKIALITLLVALLTLIAAALVVPEVRYFFGLEKRPEERATQRPPASPGQGESKPPAQTPSEENPKKAVPKLRYVPLPNAAPLPTPKTLVTAIPSGQDQPKTIEIGGEQVPVMTQAEVKPFLDRYVDPNSYTALHTTGSWEYTKPIDVWLTVSKDGQVLEVNAASEGVIDEGTKAAIREWKFKPFVVNGEKVAVQTVIQLDSKKPPPETE